MQAIHWLTLLVEKESSHNYLPIFNIFLSGCGSTTKQSDIEGCLEKMETYFLGKSEITYCELLKVCSNILNMPIYVSQKFFFHDIVKVLVYLVGLLLQSCGCDATIRRQTYHFICCLFGPIFNQHLIALFTNSLLVSMWIPASSNGKGKFICLFFCLFSLSVIALCWS